MICAETKVFPVEALREFSTRVFLHLGCPKADAEQAADVLACADLRGIDSHGIARLHIYFEMLSEGGVNPKPDIEIVRSTLSTATVDASLGRTDSLELIPAEYTPAAITLRVGFVCAIIPPLPRGAVCTVSFDRCRHDSRQFEDCCLKIPAEMQTPIANLPFLAPSLEDRPKRRWRLVVVWGRLQMAAGQCWWADKQGLDSPARIRPRLLRNEFCKKIQKFRN